VEQRRIDRHGPRFAGIDAATFASKQLDNAARYVKRQAYIHDGQRLVPYGELDQWLQPTPHIAPCPPRSPSGS